MPTMEIRSVREVMAEAESKVREHYGLQGTSAGQTVQTVPEEDTEE